MTSCQDESNTTEFNPSDYSLLGKWVVEGRWIDKTSREDLTNVIKDTIEFMANDNYEANDEYLEAYTILKSNKFGEIKFNKSIPSFQPRLEFNVNDLSFYQSRELKFFGLEINYYECEFSMIILFNTLEDNSGYDYNYLELYLSHCNEELILKGKRIK